MGLSKRKQAIKEQADKLAENRDSWINRNGYFYKNDRSYMQFLVGDGKRILELGCGTGQLLNALNPSYGVGVDLSINMISAAKKNYPNLEFVQGDLEDEALISSLQGSFDFIILSDTIGYWMIARMPLRDSTLSVLQIPDLSSPTTRGVGNLYLL